MTDTEQGKNYFNYINRGWPEANKIKWETLPKGIQQMWIDRAKKVAEEYAKHDLQSSGEAS